VVGVLVLDAASSVAADLMLETVGPFADGVNALADANNSAVASAVNFMLVFVSKESMILNKYNMVMMQSPLEEEEEHNRRKKGAEIFVVDRFPTEMKEMDRMAPTHFNLLEK